MRQKRLLVRIVPSEPAARYDGQQGEQQQPGDMHNLERCPTDTPDAAPVSIVTANFSSRVRHGLSHLTSSRLDVFSSGSGNQRRAEETLRTCLRSIAVVALEVEADLGRQGARCYVVRAAEGGEEVVQGVLVGDVDGGEAQAPAAVLFAAEEVVLSDGEIEEVAWSDARRVLVVVLGVGRRDADER